MEEIRSLSELETLTLYGNPWSCQCHGATLKDWLLRFDDDVVKKATGIRCIENDTALLAVSDEQFRCDRRHRDLFHNRYYIEAVISSAIALMLVLLLLIIAYIQGLLYEAIGFRLHQTENETLEYDAFVMYDYGRYDFDLHDWITDEFVPRLEPRLRLFVTSRDFGAGVELEMLASAITESKRTLIIL